MKLIVQAMPALFSVGYGIGLLVGRASASPAWGWWWVGITLYVGVFVGLLVWSIRVVRRESQ